MLLRLAGDPLAPGWNCDGVFHGRCRGAQSGSSTPGAENGGLLSAHEMMTQRAYLVLCALWLLLPAGAVLRNYCVATEPGLPRGARRPASVRRCRMSLGVSPKSQGGGMRAAALEAAGGVVPRTARKSQATRQVRHRSGQRSRAPVAAVPNLAACAGVRRPA
jgi:hypothetical protein